MQKNKKQINLLGRFLSWARRLFVSDRPHYPKQLEPIRDGSHGKLVPIERFQQFASQTWRFMPNYPTNPPQSQVFLYCDDIQQIRDLRPRKKTNQLATHRLTLALVSPYRSRVHWQGDFDMNSVYGFENCAMIVTRLLAMQLLRNRYDDVDWQGLAEKYVGTHRPRSRYSK